MKDESYMPERVKEVYLNRPFVYMIIDCQYNIPVFMGTMHDVSTTAVEGHIEAVGSYGGDGDDYIGEPVDEAE